MFHTEIGENSSLVLSDCVVVHFADLCEFVWMYEVHGGSANELVGFEACLRGKVRCGAPREDGGRT